tara:strand:- start:44 stop:298 length:255 start_codon:yes stop_codon:yes gene_type:complete
MDTTELIKNALDWADKRLTLQDQNLTETQRTYISFALSQNLVENFALSGVSQQSELYCFECEIEMPTKVDNKSVLRCGNCGLKH